MFPPTATTPKLALRLPPMFTSPTIPTPPYDIMVPVVVFVLATLALANNVVVTDEVTLA